jgi:hypothetical protein
MSLQAMGRLTPEDVRSDLLETVAQLTLAASPAVLLIQGIIVSFSTSIDMN